MQSTESRKAERELRLLGPGRDPELQHGRLHGRIALNVPEDKRKIWVPFSNEPSVLPPRQEEMPARVKKELGNSLQPPEIEDSKEVGEDEMLPFERLMWRKENGYIPGSMSDGHKIGICCEGGGAGGLVSFEELHQMDKLGLLDYADGYYGVSVGGVNVIFGATRQWQEGIDVYKEIMPKTFSKWFGLQISVDALRKAATIDRPLDYEKLRNSPVPVVIGLTRIGYFGRALARSTQYPPERFLELALQGCHIPLLAGRPKKDSEGGMYMDAMLTWESADELAIFDGCTSIVNLENFIEDGWKKPDKKLDIMAAISPLVDKTLDYYDRDVTESELINPFSQSGRFRQLIERKRRLPSGHEKPVRKQGNVIIQSVIPVDPKTIPELVQFDLTEMPNGSKPVPELYEIGGRMGKLAVDREVENSAKLAEERRQKLVA